MSEKKKYKRTKVGTVMQGEYGPFLMIGSKNNKDPKYDFTAKVAVKKADGTVVSVTDGILALEPVTNKDGQEVITRTGKKILYSLVIKEEVQ